MLLSSFTVKHGQPLLIHRHPVNQIAIDYGYPQSNQAPLHLAHYNDFNQAAYSRSHYRIRN